MHKPSPKTLDSIIIAVSVIGMASIAFLGGALAVYYKKPPYGLIDLVHQTVHEQKQPESRHAARAGKGGKKAARMAARGDEPRVTVRAGAYKGYTLFATRPAANVTNAILIDLDGHTVHEWSLPYSQFPARPKQEKSVSDSSVVFSDVYLFPNGDLIGVYDSDRDNNGYGMVKLDKDSHVLWGYGEHVDFIDVQDDGSIAAIIHDTTRPPKYSDISFTNDSVVTDRLVLLAPDGKETKRISLLDAMAKSKYKSILQKRAGTKVADGDLLEPNSVQVLDADMAKAFPMFKAGQFLISMEGIDTIAVLDPKTETFTWTASGSWHGQQDAEFAQDGTIMMFDKSGGGNPESRVLKYNPASGDTQVVFRGSKETSVYAKFDGIQQPLPNGNMLIVETNKGRMFEITSAKSVVWEFEAAYHGKKPFRINTGRRYAPEEVAFLEDKSGTDAP